jgi:hypothetical protein
VNFAIHCAFCMYFPPIMQPRRRWKMAYKRNLNRWQNLIRLTST